MNRRRNALAAAAAGSVASTVPAWVRSASGQAPVSSPPELPGNGFALGGLRSRSRDHRFFDALRATGARSGRLFFPFVVDAAARRFSIRERELAELQRVDELCADRGIRLVIACGIEDVPEAEFWKVDSWRASYVDCLSALAGAMKRSVSLYGLDLLNEPNPPWPGASLAAATARWSRWAESILDRLRREGFALPLIVQGVAGGSPEGLKHFVPFEDPNVVYSVHFYMPHEITHQGVSPRWPRRIPYPASADWGLGGWDGELGVGPIDKLRLERELRFAVAFQQRHGRPLYVGEFSCVRWAPSGSATRYVSDCLELFKRYGWSWAYHEFRGWPGWDAEVASEDPDARSRSASAPTASVIAHYLY